LCLAISTAQLPVCLLECGDPRLQAQRQPDGVEPRQHHRALAGGYVQGPATAIRSLDVHQFQVHSQRQIAACRLSGQQCDIIAGHYHGQQAVAVAIGLEDRAEAGREYRADAELAQCPGGLLARRAAAEIRPCNQDGGPPERGLVQHEPRVLQACPCGAGQIAPSGQQLLAITLLAGRCHLARGNQRVGIDVVAQQRCCDALDADELFHG